MSQTLPQQPVTAGSSPDLISHPALLPPAVPMTMVSCTSSELEDPLALGPPANFPLSQPPLGELPETCHCPAVATLSIHEFIPLAFAELGPALSVPCYTALPEQNKTNTSTYTLISLLQSPTARASSPHTLT